MITRRARLLLALLLFVPLLAAQETKDNEEHGPNFPMAQWLSGPDRQDFKWRVELTSPHLTFQQRNLVQVRAYLDIPPLQDDDHHDLFFVLNVADEKGNWLRDGSYKHYPLPPGLDK